MVFSLITDTEILNTTDRISKREKPILFFYVL